MIYPSETETRHTPPLVAERIKYPANRRLARMRFLSRLLDTCILLPGGHRIGLDPILGLVPAVGDFLATTFSIWLIYDAARLGISGRTLGRMILNVVFDTVLGSVPVAGDIFDALWKSNAMNMQLVEREYHPRLKERSFIGIALALLALILALYALLAFALYSMIRHILVLFD